MNATKKIQGWGLFIFMILWNGTFVWGADKKKRKAVDFLYSPSVRSKRNRVEEEKNDQEQKREREQKRRASIQQSVDILRDRVSRPEDKKKFISQDTVLKRVVKLVRGTLFDVPLAVETITEMGKTTIPSEIMVSVKQSDERVLLTSEGNIGNFFKGIREICKIKTGEVHCTQEFDILKSSVNKIVEKRFHGMLKNRILLLQVVYRILETKTIRLDSNWVDEQIKNYKNEVSINKILDLDQKQCAEYVLNRYTGIKKGLREISLVLGISKAKRAYPVILQKATKEINAIYGQEKRHSHGLSDEMMPKVILELQKQNVVLRQQLNELVDINLAKGSHFTLDMDDNSWIENL